MHFYEDNITLRDDFNNVTQKKIDFTLETKAICQALQKNNVDITMERWVVVMALLIVVKLP